MSSPAAREAARPAPTVRVNPAVSRLGFRAYDRRSFYVHDDPADPKGYRGPTEFWLQPPRPLLDRVADPRLGFQVYAGLILPATERGHHAHTHPQAFAFFYLMASPFLVALESPAGDAQEVYGFAGPTVLIFPPFTPHVVRNVGDAAAPFVDYKSWNYAEAGALTEPHHIAVDPASAARALARPLHLTDGRFGFEVGEWPTSQGVDGRPAGPARAA